MLYNVYSCKTFWLICSVYCSDSAPACSVWDLSGKGSGIRVDRAWVDLEVTVCLNADKAIVQQLHDRTTPALLRVYSAALAKCNRRPGLLSDTKSV